LESENLLLCHLLEESQQIFFTIDLLGKTTHWISSKARLALGVNEGELQLCDQFGWSSEEHAAFLELLELWVIKPSTWMMTWRKDMGPLEEKLEKMLLVPLLDLLKPALVKVVEMASAVNKKIRVETSGLDVCINSHAISPLVAVIAHLLRNVIDLGIEARGERVVLGKKEEGVLSLFVNVDTERMLNFKISDDGRGIHRSAIEEKAVGLGLAHESWLVAASDEDLFYLLFHKGFSTCEGEDCRYSGQGIGLSAVEEAVHKMGGTVNLESEASKGSCFTLKIPFEVFLREPNKKKVSNTADF
jgi:two-component sensor histidine kinase